jgi:hypothetical protein
MNRSKQMSDEEKSVEALRAENEALRKRMEKLESQVNPKPREPYVHQPVDYTANMSMPRSAMKAMVDGVPESVMYAIRGDARRPNPVQASSSTVTSTPAAQQSQPQRKGGWIEPRPLESPPGVELADRLMDHQDAKDRAELIERELKLAKARMGK